MSVKQATVSMLLQILMGLLLLIVIGCCAELLVGAKIRSARADTVNSQTAVQHSEIPSTSAVIPGGRV